MKRKRRRTETIMEMNMTKKRMMKTRTMKPRIKEGWTLSKCSKKSTKNSLGPIR